MTVNAQSILPFRGKNRLLGLQIAYNSYSNFNMFFSSIRGFGVLGDSKYIGIDYHEDS